MSEQLKRMNLEGVLAFAVAVLSVLSGTLFYGMHFVEEGHVGLYYRGGALLSSVTQPGIHFMIPFITRVVNVQVTLQTDEILNVPCGTSGGVLIYFERVEVVNILDKRFVHDMIKNYTINYDKPLIFDRVHHEINQFCSRHTLQEVYIDFFDQIDENLKIALQNNLDVWAKGLAVRDVRVTKPRLPEVIQENYVKMEAEKTKLMIAIQEQKVVEKKADTERKRAIIEAEKEAAISKIRFEQRILEEESKKNVSIIQDATYLAKQRSLADAEYYAVEKQAQANALLLTPQYLELIKYQSIAANQKIFFGQKVPDMFLTDPLIGQPAIVDHKTTKNDKA